MSYHNFREQLMPCSCRAAYQYVDHETYAQCRKEGQTEAPKDDY